MDLGTDRRKLDESAVRCDHNSCTVCPRTCGADRAAGILGFCKTGNGFAIASICLHHGEEPVLSGKTGICNIFFSHCNLQCSYCQNCQISRNDSLYEMMDMREILSRVGRCLDQGIRCVGFVSPSHQIPQMKAIVSSIREMGRNPVIVMNTNAYDRREILESLEDTVDIYLPDFKYMNPILSAEYSGAADYPEFALKALREMYRQKGSNILMDDDGLARSGLIIRHLILPGHVENSRQCLRAIAEELSPSVYVSLMTQYHPGLYVKDHPHLGRIITHEEYNEVLEEYYRLGFHRGWVQEFDSPSHYLPDFTKDHPFD